MLYAYAIAAETTLTSEAIQELRQAADGLSFDWESLVPETRVSGTFLRGYRHGASRQEALEIAESLRALSRRFPAFTLYFSGGGDLPMTQLVAGEFELFADTYETALGECDVTIVPPGRVNT